MNRRNDIIKFILMHSAVIAIISLCVRDSSDRADKKYIRAVGRDIAIFSSDDKDYLFLPGYMDEEKIKKTKGFRKYEPEIVRYTGLPTLYIETTAGNIEKVLEDKDYKEPGRISVYDAEGNKEYSGGLEYIKGRGNYSWVSEEWPKKPFTIVLKKEASLLGQPAGTKFALIANASDDTLIRNDLARSIQEELQFKYATRGSFTGLYIDGEFKGIYYLCAPPDIGKARIDIATAGSDITGGYLMEREYVDRFALEEDKIACPVVTDGEEHFIVHEPDYATQEQLEYLRDYMNKVESAIITPGGDDEEDARYSEYIDTETFVLAYLTEEIAKNYDAGVSSGFCYKVSDRDGGKLYCAPGWDFDMTLGSYQDWMGYDSPQGLTRMYPHSDASTWFISLQFKDSFRDRYTQAYRDNRDAIADILYGKRLEQTREMLAGAYEAEYIRWKTMYDDRGVIPGSDDAYSHLTDFARERIDFLDLVWSTE